VTLIFDLCSLLPVARSVVVRRWAHFHLCLTENPVASVRSRPDNPKVVRVWDSRTEQRLSSGR